MVQDKLREIRKKNNKTQQAIAEVLGTTQQQYSKYENGNNEPTVGIIIKLCKYYEVSADYLLGLDGNNT